MTGMRTSLGNLNIEETPFLVAVPANSRSLDLHTKTEVPVDSGMVLPILWMKNVLQPKWKIYKGERKNNLLAPHQPNFCLAPAYFPVFIWVLHEAHNQCWVIPWGMRVSRIHLWFFFFFFCDEVRVTVMLETTTYWEWGVPNILAWGKMAWSRAQSMWDQFQKHY